MGRLKDVFQKFRPIPRRQKAGAIRGEEVTKPFGGLVQPNPRRTLSCETFGTGWLAVFSFT